MNWRTLTQPCSARAAAKMTADRRWLQARLRQAPWVEGRWDLCSSCENLPISLVDFYRARLDAFDFNFETSRPFACGQTATRLRPPAQGWPLRLPWDEVLWIPNRKAVAAVFDSSRK